MTKNNVTALETITERTYKDGVFTTLFGEKEKICELYNALKDTDIYKVSDIKIQTLEKVLYKPYKDDLAFSVGNKFVILIEHQSTPSQNIPIRMLSYIARVYERVLNKKMVYRNSLVKIPNPELYVLYNGELEWGEEFSLKLSDAFSEPFSENFLELNVKVININTQKHHELLERSHTLKEYSLFIDKIREYLHKDYTRDDAIEMAIKDCIEHNILKEFLEKYGSEVYNMLYQEFNLDTALEVARAEGKELGKAEGITLGIQKLFEMLIALNMPKETRIEKLYEAFPEDKDLVDDVLKEESKKL